MKARRDVLLALFSYSLSRYRLSLHLPLCLSVCLCLSLCLSLSRSLSIYLSIYLSLSLSLSLSLPLPLSLSLQPKGVALQAWSYDNSTRNCTAYADVAGTAAGHRGLTAGPVAAPPPPPPPPSYWGCQGAMAQVGRRFAMSIFRSP